MYAPLPFFVPKSGNLNMLGSYDTQVSEPGPLWSSCLFISFVGILILNIVLSHAHKWMTPDVILQKVSFLFP